MTRKQFIILLLLILAAVFFIAVVWEFEVENYLHSVSGEELESTAEMWQYVMTIMSFSMLALIIPLFLGFKSIEKHEEISSVSRSNAAKVEEERAFLMLVLESLQYPFYVIDAKNYSIRLANSAAKTLMNDESMLCYKMTHGRDEPCNTPEHPCPMEITRQTGKPTVVEHQHLGPHGDHFIAEVHSYPVFNKAGDLDAIIEYSVDISERKQAASKLAESLTLQTVLYEIASKRNVTKDLETMCHDIQINLSTVMDTTNFYIALGDEASGKLAFPYFIDEEDEAPGTVDFAKGLTEWVIKTGKSLFANKDDIFGMVERGDIELLGTLPKLWMGVPLRNNDKSIGAVVVQTYRDEHLYSAEILNLLEFVSTQIAEAIDSIRTRNELAKERSLLRTLMENTHDHIYFKDLKSRFIKISNSQANMFGLSDPNQAEGKSDFDFFTEAHARKTFDEEQNIIRTKKPLLSIDEHLILKDKPDMWVSTTKLPLSDEVGNIQGTFGITRDITQSKMIEQTVAESNNLKELLLDSITHDLRNPTGVIYSLAEMAQNNLPDDEIIKGIFSSSARLLDVLNNTSALAQAALGEQIPLEMLNLHQIATELVSDFNRTLDAAEMKLELNIPTNLVISANPIISEILNNYISNAIKYSKPGKRILVEACRDKETVIISVKDFGTTIVEADRERVFQRRVQLEAGTKRGRGLGLAIVKRIAVAHGGTAWVEPNSPQGNSFCLRIPYQLKSG